jgi:hypothetical protein
MHRIAWRISDGTAAEKPSGLRARDGGRRIVAMPDALPDVPDWRNDFRLVQSLDDWKLKS